MKKIQSQLKLNLFFVLIFFTARLLPYTQPISVSLPSVSIPHAVKDTDLANSGPLAKDEITTLLHESQSQTVLLIYDTDNNTYYREYHIHQIKNKRRKLNNGGNSDDEQNQEDEKKEDHKAGRYQYVIVQKNEQNQTVLANVDDPSQEKFVQLAHKAVRGDADAQFNLALCYEMGEHVKKNPTMAAHWYYHAAVQQHITAQSSYGHCLMTGFGVTRDEKSAATWFEKVAKQGLPQAQVNLGNCYRYGIGVSKNEYAAYEWHLKAANKNYAPALREVSLCYASGTGVKKDDKKAFEYLLSAAHSGDSIAMFYLYVYFQRNYNANKADTQSLEQAQLWFDNAQKSSDEVLSRLTFGASHDDSTAQYFLAICYYVGFGVEKSELETILWLHKAGIAPKEVLQEIEPLAKTYERAQHNDPEAMYAVATYYAHGVVSSLPIHDDDPILISKDEKQAFNWYLKATQNGHAEAE